MSSRIVIFKRPFLPVISYSGELRRPHFMDAKLRRQKKKKCCTCRKLKVLSLFYTDRSQSDLKTRRCQECCKKALKKGAMTRPAPKAKLCKKCNTKRPSKQCYKDKSRVDGLAAYCKQCDDDRTRRKQLLSKYGISDEGYRELLNSQGGVCAICLAPSDPDRKRKWFCVDHDHGTGEVRGILCSGCNKALGLLGDDWKVVLRAAQYLRGAK